jgi:hypothetical protein
MSVGPRQRPAEDSQQQTKPGAQRYAGAGEAGQILMRSRQMQVWPLDRLSPLVVAPLLCVVVTPTRLGATGPIGANPQAIAAAAMGR